MKEEGQDLLHPYTRPLPPPASTLRQTPLTAAAATAPLPLTDRNSNRSALATSDDVEVMSDRPRTAGGTDPPAADASSQETLPAAWTPPTPAPAESHPDAHITALPSGHCRRSEQTPAGAPAPAPQTGDRHRTPAASSPTPSHPGTNTPSKDAPAEAHARDALLPRAAAPDSSPAPADPN